MVLLDGLLGAHPHACCQQAVRAADLRRLTAAWCTIRLSMVLVMAMGSWGLLDVLLAMLEGGSNGWALCSLRAACCVVMLSWMLCTVPTTPPLVSCQRAKSVLHGVCKKY